MAMMMARLYTGCHDIITLRNAYHGLSGGHGRACALGSALWCPFKLQALVLGTSRTRP